MYSENVLQRYHLPHRYLHSAALKTGFCPLELLTKDKV
ncbi:hypothetical protein T05_5974 [Trichinella murrelli]|uniref:Uncharacterized protein n=1 Tax=Trichinella murrelli TaxID=144512 RepID=A0A0V0SQV3_9BILA|nr:hypothetical protein T05_5974 [Trichinella murrelli]